MIKWSGRGSRRQRRPIVSALLKTATATLLAVAAFAGLSLTQTIARADSCSSSSVGSYTYGTCYSPYGSTSYSFNTLGSYTYGSAYSPYGSTSYSFNTLGSYTYGSAYSPYGSTSYSFNTLGGETYGTSYWP